MDINSKNYIEQQMFQVVPLPLLQRIFLQGLISKSDQQVGRQTS